MLELNTCHEAHRYVVCEARSLFLYMKYRNEISVSFKKDPNEDTNAKYIAVIAPPKHLALDVIESKDMIERSAVLRTPAARRLPPSVRSWRTAEAS